MPLTAYKSYPGCLRFSNAQNDRLALNSTDYNLHITHLPCCVMLYCISPPDSTQRYKNSVRSWKPQTTIKKGPSNTITGTLLKYGGTLFDTQQEPFEGSATDGTPGGYT